MLKAERIRRKALLNEEGYKLIQDTVYEVHKVTLSKRMIDAYIRADIINKGGQPLKDKYGILPVLKDWTDKRKAEIAKEMKETSKQLMR